MGYTTREFDKVLNGAFSGVDSGLVCSKTAENTWQLNIDSSEERLQIIVRQNLPRQLGSLEIPVLLVDINMAEISSEQKKRFLDRFRRYFHKGGG